MSRKIWIPSPFFHARGNSPLDMIVVHHIGSANGKLYSTKGTVTWFTNEEVHRNKETGKIENKVSAHYILPRSPYIHKETECDVIQCVKHEDIAYHAGYSQWVVGGVTRKYLNKYSVGIELAGDGNLVEYTDYQYEHLIELVKEIMSAHNVPEDSVVGHEDIAPDRKVDPGKLFDWKRLRKGINPPEMFIMPETPVTLATEVPDVEEDDEVLMAGGQDKEGKKMSLLEMILNILMSFLKK